MVTGLLLLGGTGGGGGGGGCSGGEIVSSSIIFHHIDTSWKEIVTVMESVWDFFLTDVHFQNKMRLMEIMRLTDQWIFLTVITF